jgi:xylulokinase
MDTRAGSWSSVIAETCGVAIDRLPRLCASGEPSATLRGSFARRFGMRDDVLVAGGAGDNMCAALGAGVIDSGDACISLGTSAVYLVANAAYVPALGNGLHTHRHAVADRFVQQGCVLSAASALVWLCRTLSIDDAADFVARIEAADHSPDDVPVFTPYLAGERTPHNDPLASATMSRMRVTTGPLELGRAVLDGVGLALADCQDALVADHAAIERIALIGGGARSRVWGEIIASAIGRTLYVPAHAGVGAALGAARLARQAVGGPLIADAATREVRHIVPRTNWIEAYRRKREIFRRHYAALDRGTSLAS